MTIKGKAVVLCEDKQHAVFCRRFLGKRGWTKRQLRILSPTSAGSARAYVLRQFPKELQAHRSGGMTLLIVMIDGDQWGVKKTLSQLDEQCKVMPIPSRKEKDRVAIFVPTWNIETWLAYLGGKAVDETRKNYPRLRHENDCVGQVATLLEMCKKGRLDGPAPASLKAAWDEYRRHKLP